MRFFALVALLATGATALAKFDLAVFHLNDTHSHIESTKVREHSYGGFARVSTMIQRYRKENRNTLVLHGGDCFQGTLFYNIYKGLSDGFLLEQLGLDAMTLGNHEFDDGPMNIMPFAQQVSFPILCCNAEFSAYPELNARVKPFTILRVGGQKIGLIGAVTPDLPSISSSGDVRMLDLNQSIDRSIQELEKSGVNKIILISHCGYREELEIARQNPKLDLIVGGHSHSFLGDLKVDGFPQPVGAYPTVVGSTLVVQAWEWAKVVGQIKLTFDSKGKVTGWKGAPVPVTSDIPEDPAVLRSIAVFAKPIENLRRSVVGEAKAAIVRSVPNEQEMPMGSLIADAMLAFTQGKGAQIALMNPGGVRSDLDAGPITYDEAISVQPFNNTLVLIELTGTEIQETLNQMLAKGRGLQVSEEFAYEVRNGKVSSAQFQGAPLDPTKTYTCVVNNFMARGGDGLTALQNATGKRLDTGDLDVDALISYLKAHSPIEAKLHGRIREIK